MLFLKQLQIYSKELNNYINLPKMAVITGLITYGLTNLYSDFNSVNTLICQKTPKNLYVIENCPSIKAGTYY